MNQHVGNIIDMAQKIGAESDKELKEYVKWQEYIEPLVNEKFGLRGFQIHLAQYTRQDIKDFIEAERQNFNQLNYS